ncbi:oxidoreductase [Aspergillus pseudonomiae]|uniref:Oxidoreductase n=1 Tax=Aspergillus pseudonomiae TaxID=1506151 RepID=A0A5N7DSN1_9EURO|nr:oxidoreductase [Aspergillus pseudonomiae]KAE8409305.1 oxidoreductase [Aspergillus pseudonomiae]
MASIKLFESIPPFPSTIPVAKLLKISLSSLISGDPDAAQDVLTACRTSGFFHLDLSNSPLGEAMMPLVDSIFPTIHETMQLPLEEKMKYTQDAPRSFLGYKGLGVMKTESGAPDRCEFWTISQDDILGTTAPEQPMPSCLSTQRGLFKAYLFYGRSVIEHIFHALATQLRLPDDAFTQFHDPAQESGTILRLMRYAPGTQDEEDQMQTGLLAHTDFGSITLLVNVLGGLQVLNRAGDWEWVRPEPGCLIVNMGDAMVEWTGGVLRSNMHRVLCAPGEQAGLDRVSFAMLVRPCKEARMERLVGGYIPSVESDGEEGVVAVGTGGGGMTAWEWELKKAMALKEGKDCARSRGGRDLVI